MKTLLKLTTAISFLCVQMLCLKTFAVPANPEPVTFQLSDGSEVVVHIRGDEFFNWHETVDGYTLLRKENGDFVFAQLDQFGKLTLSEFLASNPNLRTPEKREFLKDIGQHLFSRSENLQHGLEFRRAQGEELLKQLSATQARTQTIGRRPQMVVLAEFQDVRFRTTYQGTELAGQELFDSIMNAEEHTINNAVGSVRRYFYDNSHGRLILETTVFGPVLLPHNRAFYGGNTGPGQRDANPRQMIIDALRALVAEGVDFSPFVNPESDVVDGVHIIFAGCGEENNACPAEAVWSHKWTISAAGPMTIGNAQFFQYSVSPELAGVGPMPTHIGVIVHEIGHVLGLPDFYDTDGSGSGGHARGLGTWSVMASGTWNLEGRMPPYFNIFERYLLGWAEPILLESGTYYGEITLPPISSTQSVGYVFVARNAQGNPIPNERFYIENRNTSHSWDAGIMAGGGVIRGGMMVYHMDSVTMSARTAWQTNRVNANPNRELFRIINARFANFQSSPFPQPTVDSLTDNASTANPNTHTRSWAGYPSRVPIRNIRIEPLTHNVLFTAGSLCYDILIESRDTIEHGDSVFFDDRWIFTSGTFQYVVGSDEHGCDTIHRLVLTVLPEKTSIAPTIPSDFETVKIVPNPFSDEIHITNATIGSTLYVLNLGGAVVHTQRITRENETIHLGHLPQGVYVLRIGDLSIRVVKR